MGIVITSTLPRSLRQRHNGSRGEGDFSCGLGRRSFCRVGDEEIRDQRGIREAVGVMRTALLDDQDEVAAKTDVALAEGAGPLLEAVRLFDVYTSDQLGAGRKSLAYKLTFRASDRTLTGEEAVAARDAAVAVAASRLGATLRGA